MRLRCPKLCARAALLREAGAKGIPPARFRSEHALDNSAGGRGQIGNLHEMTMDAEQSKVSVYAAWAKDYDRDVASAKYAAPSAVAKMAMPYLAGAPAEAPRMVLDAGCGTGLVGEELQKEAQAAGITLSVAGCDISPDMVKIAEARGYIDCRVMDLNIGTGYPSQKFDVATCVGTFVQGHVDPMPLLYELCRSVKTGGAVLVTVRSTLFQENPVFSKVLADLKARGHRVVVEDFQYLEGVVAKLVKIEVNHAAGAALAAEPLGPQIGLKKVRECVMQEMAHLWEQFQSHIGMGGHVQVLDACMGLGGLGSRLAAGPAVPGLRLHGCDLSPWALKEVPAIYEDVMQVDICRPLSMYPSGKFNAVLCVGAFASGGTVAAYPAIEEFVRIVRPGGSVIFSVEHSARSVHHLPDFHNVLLRVQKAGHTIQESVVETSVDGFVTQLIVIGKSLASVPTMQPWQQAAQELARAAKRRCDEFPMSAQLALRPSRPGAMKVLHACCGASGPGAESLAKSLGLSQQQLDLHAFDAAPVPAELPVGYQDMRQADVREPLWMYPDGEFDGVVCVGAFAPGGDVLPSPLVGELVRLTQPGGAVVFSVERSAAGSENLEYAAMHEVLKGLQDAGHAVTYTSVLGSTNGAGIQMVTIEKSPTPAVKEAAQRRTVGYLGVGRMGKPMVRALLASGYNVQLWDKYPSDMEYFKGLGARWTSTPKDAAEGADFVVTNLPLPDHVRQALEGADGALAGMRPGSVWADFSTTDYHNTLYLAAQCQKKGVHALECPVTNLHQLGVEVGNCAFFVGGDKKAFADVQPELDTMGVMSSHVGAIGQAQTVKLFTNITYYAQVVFGTEMLIAAKKAGICPLYAHQYFDRSSGVSAALRHFLLLVLDGSMDNSCSLEVVHKDMNLTKALDDEFKAKGSPHAAWRVLQGTLDVFNEAREKFPDRSPGEINHLFVARVLEERNSTSLQLDGFAAPSHHGAAAGEYEIAVFSKDPIGRVQPFVPRKYRVHESFVPTPEQATLLQEMAEWLTFTNYAGYLDAEALGLGFGLKEEDIHHLITWSVGTAWASDHLASYQPPDIHVLADKVKKFGVGLDLPASKSLLDACLSRAAGEAASADGQLPAWNRPQINIKTMPNPNPVTLRTLSASRLAKGDERELARLRWSLEEHGIFWLDAPVASTGFEAIEASGAFFDLPLELKQQFGQEAQPQVQPPTCRGFATLGVETLNPEEGADTKEHMDIGIFDQGPSNLCFNGPTLLPSEEQAPGFARAARAAQDAVMGELVPLLVHSLDAAYGADATSSLAGCLEEPTLIQRFLNYPAGSTAFAGRHTDNGLFTVLFVDSRTMPDAMDPSTETWRQVAFSSKRMPLVFAGDILQAWSGGRILSLPHRVRHVGQLKPRRSLAFFVYPQIASTVKPLPGGDAVQTEVHMMKNFHSIWTSGTGAGQGQDRF